jgi:hypothetical protein
VRYFAVVGTPGHVVLSPLCKELEKNDVTYRTFHKVEDEGSDAVFERRRSENCLQQRTVYEWVEKFKNGVQGAEDAARPGKAIAQ